MRGRISSAPSRRSVRFRVFWVSCLGFGFVAWLLMISNTIRFDRDALRVGGQPIEDEPTLGPTVDRFESNTLLTSDGAESLTAPTPVRNVGNLVLQMIWGRDGSAASGVSVTVTCSGDLDPHNSARRGQSDALGRIEFDALPSGKCIFSLDRVEGMQTCSILPGETTTVVVSIPRGGTLTGTVRLPNGAPLEGAEIRVHPGMIDDGYVVGRSGPDGSFVVREIAGLLLIGARATGHSPSMLPVVSIDPGEEIAIELVMGNPGSQIHGTVHGTDGAPLFGARIQVSHSSRSPLERKVQNDGTRVRVRVPQLVTTGIDGAFAFDSVAPDSTTLQVRAAGHSPHTETLRLVEGVTTHVIVAMREGVTLAGRVLDRNRSPVEGAQVTVGDYYDFFRSERRSGVDGEFVFDDLASGELTCKAATLKRGAAEVVLVGVAGVKHFQELILSDGNTIDVRVLDDQQNPIPNAWVKASSRVAIGGSMRSGTTDGDGHVRLLNCEATPHDIQVFLKGEKHVGAMVGGVLPSASEVVMHVSSVDKSTGRILLAVVDKAHNVARGAEVRLADVANGVSHYATGEDGRCSIDGLPEGIYRIGVRASGGGQWVSASHALSLGEEWDIGTVVLIPGGRVVAKLVPDHGVSPEVFLNAIVLGDGAWPRYHVARDGDTLSSETLPPGVFTLRAWGPAVAPTNVTFNVTSGLDAEIELPIAQGVPCRIVVYESVETLGRRARAIVRSSEGVVVEEYNSRSDSGSTWTFDFRLRAGDYRVEIDDDYRRAAFADLRVAPETGAELRLRLD